MPNYNALKVGNGNGYEMVSDGVTTGRNLIGPDINAYNSYGMAPLHVALQAGNVRDLEWILAQPGCDPTRLTRSGNAAPDTFLAIFLQTEPGERDRQQRIFDVMAGNVGEDWERKLYGMKPDNKGTDYRNNPQPLVSDTMRGMLRTAQAAWALKHGAPAPSSSGAGPGKRAVSQGPRPGGP